MLFFHNMSIILVIFYVCVNNYMVDSEAKDIYVVALDEGIMLLCSVSLLLGPI
jgi:hypothetical protein